MELPNLQEDSGEVCCVASVQVDEVSSSQYPFLSLSPNHASRVKIPWILRIVIPAGVLRFSCLQSTLLEFR